MRPGPPGLLLHAAPAPGSLGGPLPAPLIGGPLQVLRCGEHPGARTNMSLPSRHGSEPRGGVGWAGSGEGSRAGGLEGQPQGHPQHWRFAGPSPPPRPGIYPGARASAFLPVRWAPGTVPLQTSNWETSELVEGCVCSQDPSLCPQVGSEGAPVPSEGWPRSGRRGLSRAPPPLPHPICPEPSRPEQRGAALLPRLTPTQVTLRPGLGQPARAAGPCLSAVGLAGGPVCKSAKLNFSSCQPATAQGDGIAPDREQRHKV